MTISISDNAGHSASCSFGTTSFGSPEASALHFLRCLSKGDDAQASPMLECDLGDDFRPLLRKTFRKMYNGRDYCTYVVETK